MLAVAATAIAASVAQAQSSQSSPSQPSSQSPPPTSAAPSVAGPHLRDDIRQHYFAERKEHVLRQLARRIEIATTAQACVSAAAAPAQLRSCLQQERASIDEARAQNGGTAAP
ncbi:MAG TPA: hypothetical protein VMU33_16025 [Burkholderiaceae bacterium]|nr:hypothetical protein [Burkholderiaceae bacterium]